jgi:hypothetical protein
VVVAALAPWSAVAVWRASVAKPLTVANPPLAAAAHDGHRLVVLLVVLAALSAAAALLVAHVDARLELPATWLLPARILLGVLVLAAVVSGSTVAPRAWHSFNAKQTNSGATLNGRLFSFSSNGRVTQWKVAWKQVKAHTVVGSGARTYEIYWNRLRPNADHVRDVHNLYLQAFAELGAIGLVILFAALAIPLATGIRARRHPLLAAALGVYVAYLLHAIVDWDWEITGVMLPFFVCAAVLTSTETHPLEAWGRRLALAAAAVFLAGGVYTIAARFPLDRLSTALSKSQWAKAQTDANHASDLAPWSSEPWIALGEAELTAGLTPQAQHAFLTATHRDRNNWVAWWDLARASQGGLRQDALIHVGQLNPRAPRIPASGD